MPLEDIWTDSKSLELRRGESDCCVCRAKDNGNFEKMIHLCTCSQGSAVVHPGSISTYMAMSGFCSNQVASLCKNCGDRGTFINDGVGIGTDSVRSTSEDGSSKLAQPNSSLRKNVKAISTNIRTVKRPRSALTSKATVGKKWSHLGSLKEENGGQAIQVQQKEDMQVSESEKLGITLLSRRFNDDGTRVPIKKRKFPLVESPSASSRSPSSVHLESKTPSALEQERFKWMARGQRVLGIMEMTGECPPEDSGNDIHFTKDCVEGIPTSLVSFLEKGVSSADFSGISILAAAACTGNQGSNATSLEDVEGRAQSLVSKGAKPASLSMKNDVQISCIENQQEFGPVIETCIQEQEGEEQSDMLKSGEVPDLKDKKQENEEEQMCFNLSETDVHFTGNEQCQSTELALRSNICRGTPVYAKSNDANATGSSVQVFEDREKEVKGMLLRLDSGYLQDERSHWDLNTVMDAWENLPENLATGTGPVSSVEFSGGSENKKNQGYSDRIQVQILDAESKSDTGKLEQDKMSENFHSDKSADRLNSAEQPLAFEKHADSNILLSFQHDTISCPQYAADQDILSCASSAKNFALLEDSDARKILNLPVAPPKGFSVLARCVTCAEGETGRQCIQWTLNDISGTYHLLQGGKQADAWVSKMDASGDLKHGLDCVMHHSEGADGIVVEESDGQIDVADVKDHIELADGSNVQTNISDPKLTQNYIDNELQNAASFSLQDPISDTLVDNASTAVDEMAWNIDTTAAVDETECNVDGIVTVAKSFCKVDGLVPVKVYDPVKAVDTVTVDESVNRIDTSMAVDESVCEVDAPMAVHESVCKVGVPVVVDDSMYKVDAPVAIDKGVCLGEAPVTIDASACEVEASVTIDDGACEVEALMTIDDSVCQVETSVAISQSACSIDALAAVDKCVCRVDAVVAVTDTYPHSEMSENLEDRLEKHSAEMVTEVAYDGDYDYDDYDEDDESISDTDQVMEKQGDDDSQCEGGECRETISHEWVENAMEELEDEHVDYGYSDCRDGDDIAIVTDERFFLSLQAESICKGEETMDTEDIEHERNWDDAQQCEIEEEGIHTHQVLYDSQLGEATKAESDGQRNSLSNETAAEGTKLEDVFEDVCHKDEIRSVNSLGENKYRVKEAGHPCVPDQCEAADSRDIKHRTSLRRKYSGWDQLPEGFANAEEALQSVRDNSAKWCPGNGWAGHSGRGSRGQMGSMAARGILSHLDRMRPSNRGRDGIFLHGSRDKSPDPSLRFVSRGLGRGRAVARDGSMHGMHSTGRHGSWMDAPNGQQEVIGHHLPSCSDGPVGFGPPRPTNAAAVAAAKIESSGFVVASDGTVVKVGSTDPASRGGMHGVTRVRRSVCGTMMGRGSPIGIEGNVNFGKQIGLGPVIGMNTSPEVDRVRAGGFGASVVGPCRPRGPERCRGPWFGNNRMDPVLANTPHRPINLAGYRLTRVERSFSPPLRRGSPPHTSHSLAKSPSRSRTRSPRLWSSPRGRTCIRVERGSGTRRHSRSPLTLRSGARLERLKSPLSHHVGVCGDGTNLLPSSRSHCSPPKASKWSQGMRDRDYRKPFVSTRSLPGRMTSQSVHRSSMIHSCGRLKDSEYSRPMYSGRSEFRSDGRRSRHEGIDDGRLRQSDCHGSMYSLRSVNVGGDMRRFRHEEENCFKSYNSWAKDAMEFQGQVNPRAGDKDTDNRAATISQRERSRDDNGHFKYSRSGRSRGSFKSSDNREGDDDVAPRRRRPS